MKKIAFRFRKGKGQSFVEMAIVLSVLLLLVVGMVEFGNLLNQYINLVDGAREGARFASNNDPFLDSTTGLDDYSHPQTSFFTNIDLVIEGDLSEPDPAKRTSAIAPLELDPVTTGVRTNGEPYEADDILITFYSVSGGTITGTFGPWSPYNGYAASLADRSQITPAFIQGQLEGGAPSTGIVVVEIFYNYHQLLKLNLPIFGYVIPDPMQMHTYAIMPLSGAEATPGP
jgi:hypothetical protein